MVIFRPGNETKNSDSEKRILIFDHAKKTFFVLQNISNPLDSSSYAPPPHDSYGPPKPYKPKGPVMLEKRPYEPKEIKPVTITTHETYTGFDCRKVPYPDRHYADPEAGCTVSIFKFAHLSSSFHAFPCSLNDDHEACQTRFVKIHHCRFTIFATRTANKTPFTALMEQFSMSTWALVIIRGLFTAKVVRAMLGHPNTQHPTTSLTTTQHLIMNRRITIQSLPTTTQNPSITIRNLPIITTTNLLILVVVLISPRDLAVDSKQMPF